MGMMHEDTIAAIATPLIPSAIGIVRVSGPQCLLIISSLCGCQPDDVIPRRMMTKTLFDTKGDPLDEACFVFYKGPHSYSGEDTVEFFCHGSLYILNQLIQHICALPDCRLANHGEFTKRAFLNGKLTLSKAESVLDVIESDSQAAHQIALNQYQGQVYQTISSIREQLMTMLQKIEASLEFPDDVGGLDIDALSSDCDDVLGILNPIIASSDYGAMIKKGIRFLIIGEPNVGKSSLLNALTGEARSIVSNTAGTTRDYIDMTMQYQGVLIHLIDTAGIRQTSNDIEAMGIQTIHSVAKSCDACLWLVDATSNSTLDCPAFLDLKIPIMRVINKIDAIGAPFPSDALAISCKTGDGLVALKDALISTFIDPKQYNPQQMLCNTRQIIALNSALKYIQTARTHLKIGVTWDVIAIDIRDAIHQLSNILGDDLTEELLDGIFAKFCIGK